MTVIVIGCLRTEVLVCLAQSWLCGALTLIDCEQPWWEGTIWKEQRWEQQLVYTFLLLWLLRVLKRVC